MALDDLPQVVGVVHRRVYASDGQGGKPFTAPAFGTIMCQVQAARAKHLQMAGQHQAIVSHAIYIMPESEILPKIGDYIEVGDRRYYVRVNDKSGEGYPYRMVLTEKYEHG